MSDCTHQKRHEIMRLAIQSHRDHHWNTDKPAQRTYECSCGARSTFHQWVIQVHERPEARSLTIDMGGISWNDLATAVELYRTLKRTVYKANRVQFCGRYKVEGGLPTRGSETELRDFTDMVTDFEHQFRKIRPTRWDWLRRQDEDKDSSNLRTLQR